MAEDKKAIKYSDGNVYRTESVRVKTTSGGESDGRSTPANGNTFYSWKEVDSINLDFQAEVRVKGTLFTSDWDLGMELPGNFWEYAQTDSDSWGVGNGDDKRILYNVEFNEAFKTRDDSKEADVLWTRIESDPIIPQKKIDTSTGNVIDVPLYNSVRQITLNFNSKNTETYDSGENKGHYKYRPYFIFYTGPENIDREQGWKVRHSQPVVLNLNKDLNAIIYMPNSPVVINGNNHTWHGFIIARCFLHSVTSEDLTGEKPFTLYDGFNGCVHNTPSICPGGYSEGTDSNGYTVYFKSDELDTRSEINETHKNDEVIEDLTTGNIIVKEKAKAPRYIFLNYTKADHTEYAVTDEDGKHNEAKTFAAYINATYKEKFKTFKELTDSQITAVTFPDENYNETTATYYVATADLKKNDPDPDAALKNDKYVKVLAKLSDNSIATRYIEKTKLPYVKVRTNKDCFYVCVYDLKLAWKEATVNDVSTNLGVRMIDNSYTDEQINSSYGDIKKEIKSPINASNAKVSDADIYINPNDKWCDSWGINTDLLNIYKKNWKKEHLEFSTQNDYFMLKTEIAALPEELQVIAKYRKITLANDDVLYAKEGKKLFYTKIQNNSKNQANYIIVDENGNMLTKPVTAPKIFGVTTKVTNDNFMSQIDSSSSPTYCI